MMRLSAVLVISVSVSVLPGLCDARFVDHGVATRAVESRGVVVVQDRAGNSVVISLNNDRDQRGWLLVTDIDTGETEQVYYPEEVDTSPSLAAPFASYSSTRGRFYTGAGGVLLEFEPARREWLFHGRAHPDASLFIDNAFAEGADGRIWVGTTSVRSGGSSCHLVSYDPDTGELTDHGQMDPKELHLRWIIVDDAGWVYYGIGPARGNIVAYNPETGERRQIPDEDERTGGSGWIFLGEDGKVYGTVAGNNWRMFEGIGEVIEPRERARERATGVTGWKNATGSFADGRQLIRHSLEDGWMEIHDPATEQTRRIEFTYEAVGGMGFTSLAEGPDGKVYGSTCHPMRFISYDPASDAMTDLGGVEEAGNFCAMATTGDLLAAVSYSSGILHLYDPRMSFNGGRGEQPNPRELARWPREICRPRVCVAHPDGIHLLMSGYAGYGLVGGGLGIYNLHTGKAQLITHEKLIPHQSTITAAVLPDGTILGGTDIAAPGGGHVQASEGVIYLFDLAARQVVFQAVPVPGARAVRSVVVGPDGRVYGLAEGSAVFVFDPRAKQIVHTDKSPQHGAERALVVHDGNLYGLFESAIVLISTADFRHEVLGTPPSPVSYAGPVIEGALYFASRANLWSFRLTD